MGSEGKFHGPLLFWCGVGASLGSMAGAVLLALLGLAAGHAPRPLRMAAYGVGAVVAAYRLGTAPPVTATALLVYGVAAVMVAAAGHGASATKGTVLIATGLEPEALRRLLAERAGSGEDTGRTVAVYRTERVTDELRDLQDRYGLVLVVGEEHDPRAKERLSASGLSRQVPDIAEREVILAGPRHFQRYVRGALARLAVPGGQVRTARPR